MSATQLAKAQEIFTQLLSNPNANVADLIQVITTIPHYKHSRLKIG